MDGEDGDLGRVENEGFLRRGWGDTWKAWRNHPVVGGILFFAGLAITALGLAGWEQALAVFYVWLGVAVAVLLGNVARAPFRQRDEARDALDDALRELETSTSEPQRNKRLKARLLQLHTAAQAIVEAGGRHGVGAEEALGWCQGVVAVYEREKPENVAEIQVILRGYPRPNDNYTPPSVATRLKADSLKIKAIAEGLEVPLQADGSEG